MLGRFSLIALSLAGPTPAAAPTPGDVHIVDFEGVVGYASIQAAVDAAAPGDTLLLQAGDLGAFGGGVVIDGKPLTLIGLDPAPGAQHIRVGEVAVRNLAAGETVTLRGLHIGFDGSFGAGVDGLSVLHSAGTVRLESCVLEGPNWSNPSPSPCVVLDGALDVCLHDCDVRGSFAGGIRASRSRVTVYESTVYAGDGQPAESYAVAQAGAGPTAIELRDRSFLWLGATSVEGGTGGWTGCIHNSSCTAFTGDGGIGLDVEAGSLAVTLESTIAPGQPGQHMTWGGTATVGNLGIDVVGLLTTVPGQQRGLAAPRSVLSGDPVHVAIEGTPGEQVTLLATSVGAHRYLGPLIGVWLANGAAVAGPFDLGVIPASGTLHADVTLPAVAVGGAETFTLQAACRSAPTRFRVTPPRQVTVAGAAAPLLEPVDVLHVDASAPAGGNGRTWALAASNLHDAIALLPRSGAVPVEVWLAGGTYTAAPASAPLSRGQLEAQLPLAIYGGFTGHEVSREERDPRLNPTVLTGDLLRDDGPQGANRSDNSIGILRVHFFGPSGRRLTLDGLRFSGSTGRSAVEVLGGGLLVDSCEFDDNGATNEAGAIEIGSTMEGEDDGLVVRRSRFTRNRGGWASAITAYVSNPMHVAPDVVIEGCEFLGNISRNTFLNTTARGGAIAVRRPDSWIDVRCSTFVDNDLDAPGWIRVTVTGISAAASVRMDVHDNLFAHSGLASDFNASWSCVDPSGDDSATFNRVDVLPPSWSATGNMTADPVLVDRVGPDGTPGTGDEDARPAAGSPCIDAGENNAVPAGLTLDLDGRPRFADDPSAPNTGVGGTRVVDLGAYER